MTAWVQSIGAYVLERLHALGRAAIFFAELVRVLPQALRH